uniref:Uncharacterized protein n=1 Tax=Noctiluca scintillans TaxID=2966 RepID=A0A7S1B235_NOCSC|mmetsp:Transcript_8105/g.22397  ORF Transcript_8105/g.22397 Transcript_8105/m.22397 type:complete len:142 (+) Transcript_8105:76-501(+)
MHHVCRSDLSFLEDPAVNLVGATGTVGVGSRAVSSFQEAATFNVDKKAVATGAGAIIGGAGAGFLVKQSCESSGGENCNAKAAIAGLGGGVLGGMLGNTFIGGLQVPGAEMAAGPVLAVLHRELDGKRSARHQSAFEFLCP